MYADVCRACTARAQPRRKSERARRTPSSRRSTSGGSRGTLHLHYWVLKYLTVGTKISDLYTSQLLAHPLRPQQRAPRRRRMRGACGGIRGIGWRWRACACAGRVGSGCARLWRGFAECVLILLYMCPHYICVLRRTCGGCARLWRGFARARTRARRDTAA